MVYRQSVTWSYVFSTILYRMFVALLIAKTTSPRISSSFRTSKGLIFDYYLNRKTETNIGGRRTAGTTYLHMSSDWSHVQLCRLCQKTHGCGIGRLSIAFLQIASWIQEENFENSVWSLKQISLKLLNGTRRLTLFFWVRQSQPIVFVLIVPFTIITSNDNSVPWVNHWECSQS